MPTDLARAFDVDLESLGGIRWPFHRHHKKGPKGQPSESEKPVLQVSHFPITIDPPKFANPHSNSNPTGSFEALYNFRQLVDPVPTFTTDYFPSGTSTESAYGSIVETAAVHGTNPYTSEMLYRAQKAYALNVIANVSGIPGSWRPVYASPDDWYETSDPTRFKEMTLDLKATGDVGPYRVLQTTPAPTDLCWYTGTPGHAGTSAALDSDTDVASITFKGMLVTLQRDWLDALVLELPLWYLQGQQAGFFSTGTWTGNGGLMPLIPSAIVVGFDATVKGRWGAADKERIARCQESREFLALGPFVLSDPSVPSATAEDASLFTFKKNVLNTQALSLVAWISELVPLCPPMSG